MSRLDRAMFRVGDALEKRIGPALAVTVDHALPRLMHLGAGQGYRHYPHIPYAETPRGPVYLDVVAPQGPGPHPVLLGFHGGAWVVGRKENLKHLGAAFARRGFLVLLPQYRLAPQHQFPACVDDVAAAMRWAKAHAAVYGGDGDRVGVFGDSAGGHLSAYAAVAIGNRAGHDVALPTVASAVHWYGVFDFEQFARVPWHRTPQIMQGLFGAGHDDEAVLAEASPRSYLKPGVAVPPTLLMVGTRDPLFRQSTSYADDLRRLGAEVELKVYRGSFHGFANLWFAPDGRASIRRAGAWFQRTMGVGAARAAIADIG